MDVVVRGGIFTGLNMIEHYEVRIGPCPWTSDKYELVWRVSAPVSRERAAELVAILLKDLSDGCAFAIPPEFNIVGRLEPVNQTSGELK